MIELRTRPLRATHADAAYLVQRESDTATLTDDEADSTLARIVGTLRERFGAVPRT